MRSNPVQPGVNATLLDRAPLLGRWLVGVGWCVVLAMPTYVQGQCNTNADCNDGNPCTDDICFAGLTRFCINASNCSNGKACDGVELCCTVDTPDCGPFAVGECMPGTPIICSGGQICVDDFCVDCVNDNDCADASFCNPSVCNNGTCESVLISGPCDDGDLCTTDDTCVGGSCFGTPVDCSAGTTDCRVGVCNAATGACDFPSVADGTSCNDGDLCTAIDRCQAGVCVGGPVNGCVRLELRRGLLQATVKVGDILKVQVWAVAEGCPPPPPGVCGGSRQPLSGVDVDLTWDPAILELVPDAPGAPNPDDPCVTGCGNVACDAPSFQYAWLFSGFPDECGMDCLNDPGTSFPNNDGDAMYSALSQFTCEIACVPSTGLWITTLKFRALAPTAGLGAPTEVAIADCLGQTRSKALGGSAGQEVTGPLGAPVQVTVECVTSADCPGGSTCVDGVCGACAAPSVRAVGPRYLSITPAAGPDPIALHLSGLDPQVSCVSAYVQADGTLGALPVFQTAAAWGSLPVRDADLVAGKRYQVEADCDALNPGTSFSDPVAVTLWGWGDVDHNSDANILDVARIIDGLRGESHSVTACTSDAECSGVPPNFTCDTAAGLCVSVAPENVDIIGVIGCMPDGDVGIIDVAAGLDALRSEPNPCPGSCVP